MKAYNNSSKYYLNTTIIWYQRSSF